MNASVKYAFLAALIGCTVLVGYAVSFGSWLQVVTLSFVLAVGAVALLAHSRIPTAGLGLLLVTAVLTPVEFAVGGRTFSVCLPLAAFLCGAWLLRTVVSRHPNGLDRSRLMTAILAFMAVAVLSFLVGQYPWFPTAPAPMSAQLGGLALFLLSGGLFLVVGHEVADLRQLRLLTWLFLAAGAVELVSMMFLGREVIVGRFAITDASSVGSMFFVWLVAVSSSQALFNNHLSPLARLGLLCIAALTLARGLLLAFSWASGWLPSLVALGVILFIRFPKFTAGMGLLVIAPLLLFGAPAWQSMSAGESYSSMTRLQALQVMWHVVQRNPWLGFGPANYYQYTVLFPILGWWVRFNSHNNYVDLIGQTGIIGLLAFVWFVVEAVRLTLRLYPKVPRRGFERAYLIGALGGLAGSLASGFLADWIVPFTYNVGIRGFRSSLLFWVFLGGILSLRRITSTLPEPAVVRRTAGNRLALDPLREFPFVQSPSGLSRIR